MSTAQQSNDFSDWMSKLPNDLPIADVTLPGTHNSGSFAIGSRYKSGHLSAVVIASRCQGRSLDKQLLMGVRFLDLRVRPDGVLCHGRVTLSLTLQDALVSCRAFLSAHRGEVILARIKDEACSKATARGVDELLHALAESAEYPLFLQMRVPTIGEVRGRIVLLCDWEGGQLGVRWAGDEMRIQDEYWQSTGTSKWRIVRRHLNRAAPSTNTLQVHFTSATGLPRKVPIQIARSVNPKLSHYIRSSTHCRHFLGIIAMDFPSAPLCELIVRLNWKSLDPGRSVGVLHGSPPTARDWLDDLRCEFIASLTRADAAELGHPDEVRGKVEWLSRVYVRLSIERVSAELREPAVEELGAIEDEARAAEEDEETPPVINNKRTSGGRSFIYRLGARCIAPRRSRDEDVGDDEEDGGDHRNNTSTGFSEIRGGASSSRSNFGGKHRAKELVEDQGRNTAHPFYPPSSGDWLENLHCELRAAASRADAAVLSCREPEELHRRVQWVARVFVRLVVDQVQATLFVDSPELLQLVVECGDNKDPFASRRRMTTGEVEDSSDSEPEASTEAEFSDPSECTVKGSAGKIRSAPEQESMQDFATWAAQRRT